MTANETDALCNTIAESFISGNEQDRHGEPANIVDALFAIARSLQGISMEIFELRADMAKWVEGALGDDESD